MVRECIIRLISDDGVCVRVEEGEGSRAELRDRALL